MENLVSHTWTVVKVYPENDTSSFTQVAFLQSQRIYKLTKGKEYDFYLHILNEAKSNNGLVLVKRESEQSDVILSVEAGWGKMKGEHHR